MLLGGSTLITLLSGCQSAIGVDSSSIDVKLYNYTNDPQSLKFELLRTGNHSYDDALVAEREYEVPPPEGGESAGTIGETEIAKERAYIVRILLRNSDGEWFHHHFYPGESAEEMVDIRIYSREETNRLYVRF